MRNRPRRTPSKVAHPRAQDQIGRRETRHQVSAISVPPPLLLLMLLLTCLSMACAREAGKTTETANAPQPEVEPGSDEVAEVADTIALEAARSLPADTRIDLTGSLPPDADRAWLPQRISIAAGNGLGAVVVADPHRWQVIHIDHNGQAAAPREVVFDSITQAWPCGSWLEGDTLESVWLQRDLSNPMQLILLSSSPGAEPSTTPLSVPEDVVIQEAGDAPCLAWPTAQGSIRVAVVTQHADTRQGRAAVLEFGAQTVSWELDRPVVFPMWSRTGTPAGDLLRTPVAGGQATTWLIATDGPEWSELSAVPIGVASTGPAEWVGVATDEGRVLRLQRRPLQVNGAQDASDGGTVPIESWASISALGLGQRELLVLHPRLPEAPTRRMLAIIDPEQPNPPLLGLRSHVDGAAAVWDADRQWVVATALQVSPATDEEPASASATIRWVELPMP